MKTAIVYVSTHHGNTKKLVDAMAADHEIQVIDGTKDPMPNLTDYDCIGFAAGIAFAKFYQQMLDLMENSLPENKKVFFLFTCGTMKKVYTQAAVRIAKSKNCAVLGEYGCLGFDTFGPFQLIGGIAKGHPDADEIAGAVKFYDDIVIGAMQNEACCSIGQ